MTGKVAFLGQPNNGHLKLFAEGLRRHGWSTNTDVVPSRTSPPDLIVCWGVRRLGMMGRTAYRTCVLEHGYIGDRFRWTSVSFGGKLNGEAEFQGAQSDPARRLQNHPDALQPYRGRAERRVALICGQVPTDMAVRGVNYPAWLLQEAKNWRLAGWEVKYRSHPLASRFNPGIPEISDPKATLQAAMDEAGVVVAYSSNALTDATLAGIPIYAGSRVAMAFPLSVAPDAHPDWPEPPERETWANELAWKQWSEDELSSGVCWEHVGC